MKISIATFSTVMVFYLGVASNATLAAWNGKAAEPPNDEVEQLVRNAAYNQLQAMRHPTHYYQYQLREETPQSSRTSLEIETREGTVERLLEVNGKPPSEAECEKDLKFLHRIASNPRLQQSRFRNQQQELTRREKLIANLPEAFLYQRAGTDKNTGWVVLKFQPNPDFQPDSRVANIMTGLAGTMQVDPASQRIAKINGRVIKAVSFGWGFLAKIYPGGQFDLEQSRLPDGSWHLSKLSVVLHGSELVFKKLNVDMTDILTSFQPVSDHLTIPQAINILEKIPVYCQGR